MLYFLRSRGKGFLFCSQCLSSWKLREGCWAEQNWLWSATMLLTEWWDESQCGYIPLFVCWKAIVVAGPQIFAHTISGMQLLCTTLVDAIVVKVTGRSFPWQANLLLCTRRSRCAWGRGAQNYGTHSVGQKTTRLRPEPEALPLWPGCRSDHAILSHTRASLLSAERSGQLFWWQ